MPVNELGVHIFGGGAKGESIALELPGEGKWGIVDFYRGRKNGRDRIIEFLKANGVQNLEFVALTHPHSDHFRGMSTLFDAFKVQCFWTHEGITLQDLARIISLTEDQETFDELKEIYRIRKRDNISIRTMGALRTLYPIPMDSSNFSIKSLAPSARNVEKYRESFSKCFLPDGAFELQKGDLLDHNLISAALLIQFGDAKVVLGGDVEEDGWVQILNDHAPEALRSNLVKVSHHGSTNGYCENLWRTFSPEKRAVAVITPYLSSGLPKQAGYERIRKESACVYTTCRKAISFPFAASSTENDFGTSLSFDEEQLFNTIFSNVAPASTYPPGLVSLRIKPDGSYSVSFGGDAGVI